jgi:exodeoxyribonuclease VII large subunit
MDDFVLTVTQLNNYVEDKLYSDSLLSDLYLRGELTGVNMKYMNAFFSLKDENALIECMIPDVISVPNFADLKDGETIIARGSATLYKKSGRYRFLVRSFTVAGLGDMYLKLTELKEKLSSQGIFDPAHKKMLPRYPRRIGIVTSANGAAVHDIMNIAARRNNTVKLSVYPAKVQGETASDEIVQGIRYFNRMGNADIVIVARGGGSAEDMSAFNTEKVVMAVYDSIIPVVSAVGHEIDFTLCDFAADVRVPTPSAAAEICLPDKQEIQENIMSLVDTISYLVSAKMEDRRFALESAKSSLNLNIIRAKMDVRKKEISFNKQRIYDILLNKMDRYQNQISEYAGSIKLLNPYEAFKRGYAVVRSQGAVVMSIDQVREDDELTVLLKDGSVSARVTGKRCGNESGK